MQWNRVRLLMAGVLCLGLSAPLSAQDAGPDPTVLQAIADRIDAIPDMDALYAACPADIFDTRSGWLDGLRSAGKIGSVQACHTDPAMCAQACLEGGDGRSCFFLARVYEDTAIENFQETFERSARKAHVLACAQGVVAGCVGRGQGISYWMLDGDPFASMAPNARESCLFSTFEMACTKGNAWGCAMSGLTYAKGNGVAADPDHARTLFRTACLLAQDSASGPCVFATQEAALLDGR